MLLPHTAMQFLSVQTNQQYGRPSAFANRCSPLTLWNVQSYGNTEKCSRPPFAVCTMDLQRPTELLLFLGHAPTRYNSFLYFVLTIACGF